MKMENRAITIPPIEIDSQGKVILESIKQKQINFGKKFHPEFEGYLTENKGGVWISHIQSKEIGQGHFSLLIKELKEKYKFIKIPTPSKMMFDRATHLGFKIKREFFGEPYNEMGTIMFWEKRTAEVQER